MRSRAPADPPPPSGIEAIPALRDLPPDAHAELGACLRPVDFRDGDRIIPLFRARPRIVFLRSGVAKLSGTTSNGVERILYVYRPGEIVGARFLLDSPEDGHEVVAMTDVDGLAAERADFLAVCERHPDLMLAVTREFTTRLERLTGRYLGAITAEVPVRLAQLLLDFQSDGRGSGDGFMPLAYPLTHKTMAQIVGASRPHLSATLGQLEAAGVVRRVSPRELRIHPERLREIALANEFDPPE